MPSLLSALRDASSPVVTVELRPPRAELAAAEGIDAWIDSYHAIRALTRQGIRVLVTDNAVGAQEENNLRHLVANLGETVERQLVVPFLTTKHSLEFCLEYADQAVERGFRSLVVLGGDKHVGRPRCVEHAWELRKVIRERHPQLELGGWANPHADPALQVRYLTANDTYADFYLTQVVSHHDVAAVGAFLDQTKTTPDVPPGVFGVFYYRSANPRTLEALRQFLPAPVDQLSAEFGAGATPVEVAARTLRMLTARGVQHVYVSNLPLTKAPALLQDVLCESGMLSAR